jgi:hypothetical protein
VDPSIVGSNSKYLCISAFGADVKLGHGQRYQGSTMHGWHLIINWDELMAIFQNFLLGKLGDNPVGKSLVCTLA